MKSLIAPGMALLLVACTGEPPTAPPTPEDPPEENGGEVEVKVEITAKAQEAAELAKALRGSDEPAAELERRGMSAEQLDALMFEIASDPALSEGYRAALAQ